MTSRSVSPGYWAACFVTRGKRTRERVREGDGSKEVEKKEIKTKKKNKKGRMRGTRKQVASAQREAGEERRSEESNRGRDDVVFVLEED